MNRVVEALPRRQPSGERTNVLDAPLFQLQRHTGAGRFAGSSAIKNDVAISRDLVMSLAEIFRRDA
jgi:hypothetical protein